MGRNSECLESGNGVTLSLLGVVSFTSLPVR